jgi:2-methylcitrate dehydratase PrpD
MTSETVTRQLATAAVGLDLADVPEPVQTIAKQAILDWLGVTLAGSDEPVTEAVASYTALEGGHPRCTAVGRADRASASAAAWVNGTASHALDYDDVNFSIPGHATAPVLPAVLALAEETHATGVHVLEAFIAGYETACRIGQLVASDHYARGFHATATIGYFGAAAASSRLIGLDVDETARAFGIAAVQAAGLKVSFGTSCKPLQVGMAARAGLVAARLAQLRIDAPLDILDHRLGFPYTHSDNRSPTAALGPARYVADFAYATTPDAPTYPFHLQTNLFRYHASCYETHSATESALALSGIEGVTAANITALEAKFSLRHTVAMALVGKATASPIAYEESVTDPLVEHLQELARVEFDGSLRVPQALVRIRLHDGRGLEHLHDSSLPNMDLDEQRRKLSRKFRSLAAEHLPPDLIGRLESRILQIESEADMADLMSLTCLPSTP